MATEETSRTAEAENGSTEPMMTSSNDSGPVLFGPTGAVAPRAPQPPMKVDIWEQIRLHIDPVSKLASTLSSVLLVAWSVFLLLGGVFFLLYYSSIGFFPELDLKASVTLLAVSAMTGTILLLILSVSLIAPALFWRAPINDKALKSLWYDEDKEFLRPRTILWFILPLVSFGVAVLLMFCGWHRWGTLSISVGFPVSLSVILIITGTCLRRKLPDHFNRKDKRAAIFSLLQSTSWSILMFSVLLVLVIVTIRANQEYQYQTIWTLVAVCVILLYNIVILIAAYLPPLKFIFIAALSILIIFSVFPFTRPIPKLVMNWFQFGSIEHASIILNEVGCNISRNYKLPVEQPVSDQTTCILSDVMILSRLGTPYYIQIAGTPQKRLTIPAQNILSWSVIEPQKIISTGSPQNPQNPASTTETTKPSANNPSKENSASVRDLDFL